MSVWELWRQDDGGNRYRMGVHSDRVEALTRMLVVESGPVHKQTYWVEGPPGAVCDTHRELHQRLAVAGHDMNAAGRSLQEFLRAWWLVSRPVADQPRLDPDTVAAMVVAAATIEPPPLRPAWRTRPYRPVREPASYDDWEQVVLSQIADLADFADAGPLDPQAYFGIDAPRPPSATRATSARWCNFDPMGYLECGLAGVLGNGDRAAPLTGTGTVSWADLARLAICGQVYE